MTTAVTPLAHAAAQRLQVPVDRGPVEMGKTSRWVGLIRSHRAERVMMTRQMAMMLGAGTPVVPALEAAAAQTAHPAWRAVLLDVRHDVEGGASLAAAFARRPKFFDAVYRTMIAAGEATGQLAEMFRQLAVLIRRQQQVRNRLVGAMIYPSLLLVLCLGVSVGMLVGVLPRFTGLFETLGKDLPASTQALMSLSTWLLRYGWMVGVGVVGAVSGCVFYVRTPAGWDAACRLIMRLPGSGGVVRKLSLARLARLMGLLLTSRVPLLEAIGLTQQSMSNPAYRRFLERLSRVVSDGAPMAPVFRESKLITPAVTEVVQTGEVSGDVGGGLSYMADCMDEDNTELIAVLSRLIEPMILLFMGLVVGGVAFSLFLPLFDLATAAGG